jgi:hypothetical protein
VSTDPEREMLGAMVKNSLRVASFRDDLFNVQRRSIGNRRHGIVRMGIDAVLAVGISVLVVAVAVGMSHRPVQAQPESSQVAQVTMTGPPTVWASQDVTAFAGDPPAVRRWVEQQLSERVHPVSTEPSGSVTGTPGALQQTITVRVLPGGPLRVTPARFTVRLHREGSSLVGDLGPIKLADPRGTLVGWRVRAKLVGDRWGPVVVVPDGQVAFTGRESEMVPGNSTGDRSGPVVVVPDRPVAVTGRRSEVNQSYSQVAGDDRGVVLMWVAHWGGGGGSFSVQARVIVGDSHQVRGGSLTFVLSAS